MGCKWKIEADGTVRVRREDGLCLGIRTTTDGALVDGFGPPAKFQSRAHALRDVLDRLRTPVIEMDRAA